MSVASLNRVFRLLVTFVYAFRISCQLLALVKQLPPWPVTFHVPLLPRWELLAGHVTRAVCVVVPSAPQLLPVALFMRSRSYGMHTHSAIIIVGTTCVRLPVFKNTCLAVHHVAHLLSIVSLALLMIGVQYMLVGDASTDYFRIYI